MSKTKLISAVAIVAGCAFASQAVARSPADSPDATA